MTVHGSGRRAVLVAAHRWVETAQLALAAREAGFEVGIIAPSDHPLADLEWIDHLGDYSPLHPVRSVVRALNGKRIDLLLPVDDQAVSALFQAYVDPSTDRCAARAIARSLGNPETFRARHNRAAVIKMARDAGAVAAETWPVEGSADLAEVTRKAGFPAVLKADGSFGGQGVIVVNDLPEALEGYRRLNRPPGLRSSLTRLIMDDETNYLERHFSRQRPIVSLQQFVVGTPATLVAAAWNGQILDHVGVRVLRTAFARGPATVVEPIEHPDMAYAATVLARDLGLSGLFGLDFMLTQDGKTAALIELNPRTTPTAHLYPPSLDSSLLDLLAECVGAPAPTRHSPLRRGAIALFPQEEHHHPDSRYLVNGQQDIPQDAPDVVDLCRGEPLLRVRPMRTRLGRLLSVSGSRLVRFRRSERPLTRAECAA